MKNRQQRIGTDAGVKPIFCMRRRLIVARATFRRIAADVASLKVIYVLFIPIVFGDDCLMNRNNAGLDMSGTAREGAICFDVVV